MHFCTTYPIHVVVERPPITFSASLYPFYKGSIFLIFLLTSKYSKRQKFVLMTSNTTIQIVLVVSKKKPSRATWLVLRKWQTILAALSNSSESLFFQNDKDLLVCKALYFETVKHKAVFQIRRCDTRSIFFYLARLALGYSIKYKTFEKEANYFFTKFWKSILYLDKTLTWKDAP